MGSIQSLKSWALAARANEDTDVQVSGYLGNVNKTFGRQLLDMIDKLQGIISQRTKAYNSLVNSINKAVEGKDGIGTKTALAGITAVRGTISAVMAATSGSTTGTIVAGVMGVITGVISSYFTGVSVKHSANAAVYDYEKMASQLGYYKASRTIPDDPATPVNEGQIVNISDMVSGASMYLDLRDALMPRPTTSHLNADYGYAPGRGTIGTLRRM